MSNYHSYKETTIKLLPYHSFYGGQIPQEKLTHLFWQSTSEKHKTIRILLYQLPPKKFQTSTVMKFSTFHIKHMWLLLLLQNINWLPASKKNVSCLCKGKNVYCTSLYTFSIQCFCLLFRKACASRQQVRNY